jgi:hypothetical protein
MPFDDSRVCPACGGSRWEELLHVRTGRIMTGDQRIVPGDLHKIRCADCGVAANARVLSDADLDHLYGDEYILNTQGREEHRFYTASGPVPRPRSSSTGWRPTCLRAPERCWKSAAARATC